MNKKFKLIVSYIAALIISGCTPVELVTFKINMTKQELEAELTALCSSISDMQFYPELENARCWETLESNYPWSHKITFSYSENENIKIMYRYNTNDMYLEVNFYELMTDNFSDKAESLMLDLKEVIRDIKKTGSE